MVELTPRANQLRRRHTGQRAGEEDVDEGDRPTTPTPSASDGIVLKRASGIPLPGDDVDETAELGGGESDGKEGEEGEGEDEDKKPLGRFSSMTQKLKSPLMSTINLEELRESFSKNVEGK